MPADSTPSRRAFVKTTGAALLGCSAAGCVSRAVPQSEENAAETATDAAPTVTVTVGPRDELRFAPAEIAVRPGTTVRWEWESGDHSIAVRDQPTASEWNGTPGPASELYGAEYSYEHTFTTLGSYEYYCKPHDAAGMTGAVVVTENPESGTATESEPTTESDPETPSDADGVTDARDRSEVTVAVGPGGDLRFAPARLRIASGTTVTWDWQSDNHNVVVERRPDGSDWSGTAGSETTTYDEGHTLSHEFDAAGAFEYVCYPHEGADMTGAILVE